jgi:hypothetical protein
LRRIFDPTGERALRALIPFAKLRRSQKAIRGHVGSLR